MMNCYEYKVYYADDPDSNRSRIMCGFRYKHDADWFARNFTYTYGMTARIKCDGKTIAIWKNGFKEE